MKKIKILFVVLVLFMLGGCSYMEYPEENVKTGPTLSVSSASVVATTGGTRTTNTISEGSMGIFRLPTNGYSAQNNVQYDCIGAEWIKNTEDIYLNNNPATVCAYYPYSSSITDPSSIPLSSQKYDATVDLCYGNGAQNPSNFASNVSFNMEHAYARMTFNITRSPNYSGTGLISNISITNDGLKKSGVLNITDGSYTSEANGTVAFDPGIKSIDPGTTVSTSALLIPVAGLSGSLLFSFDVDGQTKEVKVDVGLSTDLNGLATLKAGYNYQINFTLGTSLVESNCYIVKPKGTVYIPISRANKGWKAAGLGTALTSGDNWTADLLWTDNSNGESSSGVVQSVIPDVAGQYITVKAGSKSGNAVIVVKNSSGTTVWSWHIWVTSYDPNTNGTTYTYPSNGLTFMDRNLGATSTKLKNRSALGLLYQWGRKDPFPGSASATSSSELKVYGGDRNQLPLVSSGARQATPNGLQSAIQNPGVFYYGTDTNSYDWYSASDNHDDSLWGGASVNSPTAKTVFDPCPVGWRVPAFKNSNSPWNELTEDDGNAVYDDYFWSYYFYGYDFSSLLGYYPAAGYRSNGGYLSSVGTGEYWTATVSSKKAYTLELNDGSVGSKTKYRATGQSVRCVKEQ